MTEILVSAITSPVVIGDTDANLAAIRTNLLSAQAGPHLIVFTELATSGYVFVDADEARLLALDADDPRLTALADAIPDGAVVVVGFCERAGDVLYNSALVLGGSGVLGCYRKSHLWDAEADVFTPGDEAGAVFDTPIGQLGVAVCYDNEFPEVPRRLALAGAELLALPVNWPVVERPRDEHPPELLQAMAAARSSRLPTVIADRHGAERGVVWTGGTAVISGDGWVVATPGEDGVASAVIDTTTDKAIGPRNDLFADRRPELYADVSAPAPVLLTN
ncbi:nitrilase-related carbon-nitrogen hydrolase [Mycobacterium sp. NPDC048908]|uniref:nitrilase-related carbon-nitrogen hydrolase n=1 Tax=Mycobacterium sp. NPDC048908 TaxID=3364292 RepID=UPI00371C14AB